MLKNISKLEIVILYKTYSLLCEMDAPLEHVKEALFQFQKYVGYIEDQVKAQIDAKKQLEDQVKVVEEPKPE